MHAARGRRGLFEVVPVVALVALVAAFGAGCAGSGRGGTVDTSRFPSATEVAAIAARPLPPLAESGPSPVSVWTFQGPFPETFADVPLGDVDAVSRIIAPAVGQRLSEAGRCVARELAPFILAHERFPDDRLKAHLAGRCGSMGSSGGATSLALTGLSPDDDDATVAASAVDDLTAQALSLPATADLGLALVRSEDRTKAVAVTVALVVDARLEPTSRRADHGTVTLEGRVVDAADVEAVWANANTGATGTASCLRVGRTPPQFSFRCPVDVADPFAAVAVTVRRRGRFLGQGVGQVLTLPSPSPVPLAWAAPVWGAPAPLGDDDAALGQAFIERVNRVRAGAGVAPLVVEDGQMGTAAGLAPHYFGAAGDHALVDRIALGALAGWQVKTPVRDGTFASLLVPGASLDELVGAALDSPAMRSTLLDPAWSLVAIGATRSEGRAGLLVTTWARYDTTDDARLAKRVFNELKAERIRRGYTNGLGEVGMEDAVAKASARLSAGEDPNPVLRTLLHQTSEQMQNEFTGWFFITADPDHIAWPTELLSPKMTYVAVAAGSRVEEGSPWASTAILIVGLVAAGTVADVDADRSAVLPAR